MRLWLPLLLTSDLILAIPRPSKKQNFLTKLWQQDNYN